MPLVFAIILHHRPVQQNRICRRTADGRKQRAGAVVGECSMSGTPCRIDCDLQAPILAENNPKQAGTGFCEKIMLEQQAEARLPVRPRGYRASGVPICGLFARPLAGTPPSRLRPCGPCGKDRPAFVRAVLADSRFRLGCRSSVVEHSLGKGEVDSSILSGSTRKIIPSALERDFPPEISGAPSRIPRISRDVAAVGEGPN